MAYPKLVTVSIIEEDDKILLIKRGNEPEIGKWAFPAGTGAFKKFSNPEDAVKDEVEYDLRAKFIPTKLLNIYYCNDNPPTLSIVYIGKIKGKIKTNKDSVIEYKLFSKNELTNLDLAFDQNKILLDYCRLK